jgi:hypothetical protein
MALLVRYRISLAIVIAALATVAGVFALARPGYDPERGSEMIDVAEMDRVPLTDVRAAFAKQGLPLRYEYGDRDVLMLSSQSGPLSTDTFYVYYVAKRSGRIGWGPELEDGWEKRFGNLLVHYGGEDEAMLARVRAAVDDLD